MGDSSSITIYGKGQVVIDVKLPGRAKSNLVLRDVLYAPMLETNLLSWRAICDKGFFLDASNSDIFVCKGSREGNIVLWAKLEDWEFVLQQMKYTAHLTSYENWHQAFGHASPQYIDPSRYSDGHLIAKRPRKFECTTCALTKSTRSKPKSTTYRATKPWERIHSDLSGRLSVPSNGKSLY